MGLRDAIYRYGGCGGKTPNSLGCAKSSLEGIQKTFTKIEAHSGISERLVIDLAIEDALMIWYGIRYHLGGYITPLADMP